MVCKCSPWVCGLPYSHLTVSLRQEKVLILLMYSLSIFFWIMFLVFLVWASFLLFLPPSLPSLPSSLPLPPLRPFFGLWMYCSLLLVENTILSSLPLDLCCKPVNCLCRTLLMDVFFSFEHYTLCYSLPTPHIRISLALWKILFSISVCVNSPTSLMFQPCYFVSASKVWNQCLQFPF